MGFPEDPVIGSVSSAYHTCLYGIVSAFRRDFRSVRGSSGFFHERIMLWQRGLLHLHGLSATRVVTPSLKPRSAWDDSDVVVYS